MEIGLVSIDPARNRFRSYVLSVEPDLFAPWVLVVSWGRIGQPTRRRIALSGSAAVVQHEAQRLVRLRLRHGYEVVHATSHKGDAALEDVPSPGLHPAGQPGNTSVADTAVRP